MVGKLLVLALALAAPPPDAFTTDHFNLRGALLRAALAFHPQDPGTYLDVTRVHEHWKINDQAAFERWEATTRDGRRVGELVRFRNFGQEGTLVDLALKLEDGRIVDARALQPVLLRGKPFLALPDFLVGLQAHRMADVAGGLEALFEGLIWLDGAVAAQALLALDDKQQRALVGWVRKNVPPPVRGAPFPAFEATDESGARFDARKLRGKPAVVLVGVLHMPRDRRAFDWAHQYVAQNKGRFGFVEIVQSTAEAIAQYRRMGGQFQGTVLPDPKLQLHKPFKGVFTPTLYFYDAQGKLVGGMRPISITSYDKVAATLDGVR